MCQWVLAWLMEVLQLHGSWNWPTTPAAIHQQTPDFGPLHHVVCCHIAANMYAIKPSLPHACMGVGLALPMMWGSNSKWCPTGTRQPHAPHHPAPTPPLQVPISVKWGLAPNNLQDMGHVKAKAHVHGCHTRGCSQPTKADKGWTWTKDQKTYRIQIFLF